MKVSEEDDISIDGNRIDPVSRQRPVLLAFYKPRGIVCTSSKKDRAENIVDYLNYPLRIYPVGRLDKDSEGLILLTNQGFLPNLINRSRHFHEKEYLVTVDRPLTAGDLSRLSGGIWLPELNVCTRPCKVWQLSGKEDSYSFHIILTQGLNRQIRRMCTEIGCRVQMLKRIRIMKLRLNGLQPGEYREIQISDVMDIDEIDEVMSLDTINNMSRMNEDE